MVRFFRHYLSLQAIVLAIVESAVFFCVVLFVQLANGRAIDGAMTDTSHPAAQAALVSTLALLVMSAVGMFSRQVMYRLDAVVTRALVSFVLAMVVAFLLFSPFAAAHPGSGRLAALAIVGCCLAAVAVGGVFVQIFKTDMFRRHILVIGSGAAAAKVAQLAEADGQFAVKAFVQFDDGAPQMDVSPVIPFDHLGSVDCARQFLAANEIDEIVVATQQRQGLPVSALLDCRLRGIPIHDYPSFCEKEAGYVDLDTLLPSWLIFSDGFRMNWGRFAVKAAFDYLAASLLLLASLPITIPTAIAIRLTSPGPVFYRQERAGRGGKVFQVLKFRSMRTDAEANGPQWARSDDDRVTLVGRVIRKLRIDEIPQVVNVLKGEMSFIGPRPERPVFVASLTEAIPYFNERHRLKPGITGWAQVRYPYGASIEDAKCKLSYDLYYLKNGGIFLDLMILLQTVRVILWPHGAR